MNTDRRDLRFINHREWAKLSLYRKSLPYIQLLDTHLFQPVNNSKLKIKTLINAMA